MMDENVSGSGPLPPDHYRALITYGDLPLLTRLKTEFVSSASLNRFLSSEAREHPSRKGVSKTPREQIFLPKRFGFPVMGIDEAIAWGLENGYVPATHVELYEFVRAYPAPLLPFNIVACGTSLCYVNGGAPRFHVCVSTVRSERFLFLKWVGDDISEDSRFLFVRARLEGT